MSRPKNPLAVREELVEKTVLEIIRLRPSFTVDEARELAWKKSYQVLPAGPDEPPYDKRPAIILTFEEIRAAAHLMALLSEGPEMVQEPELGMRTGDIKALSVVNGVLRESIVRRNGSEKFKESGDVVIYRPVKESRKEDNKISDLAKAALDLEG